MTAGRWSVWVDTGGTFTDCLAVAPDASVRRAKVLSSGCLRGRLLQKGEDWIRVEGHWPATPRFLRGFQLRLEEMDPVRVAEVAPDGRLFASAPLPARTRSGGTVELSTGEPAPILATRLVTRCGPEYPLPPLDLRLATTRATNALLERKGARTALVVSRGFADLLTIGTQQRPDLFALKIVRPPPLADAVFEIGGRLDAAGEELAPLEPADLEELVRKVRASGAESIAISLLHAWANPAHEQAVEAHLRKAGCAHVTCGADLSPGLHYLNRTRTALANAYLAPVMEDYLAEIQRSLPPENSSLQVMTGAGGLMEARDYRARDSLLSGPAAGVVGAAAAGRAAGFAQLIAFDMGGTSTDVSRIDGDLEYDWSVEIADLELVTSAVAIHTVAAGGGSICRYARGAIQVGPESAGASPGPACYGGGGPLTLTDCNLLLGRLDERHFGIPLDRGAADRALDSVLSAMESDSFPDMPDRTELLEGFVAVANERMAEAVRRISLRRGFDPADHALVSFGGAGGQHVCGIAAHLGIRSIVVPPDPALLSARGLGAARREAVGERQLLESFTGGPHLDDRLAQTEKEALRRLAEQGCARERTAIHRRLADVRLPGQETTLTLEISDPASLPSDFRKRYRSTYGYLPPGDAIEIVALRVFARETQPNVSLEHEAEETDRSRPEGRRVRLAGGWLEIPTFNRAALATGDRVEGPALVEDPHSTIVVEPEWTLSRDASGALLLEHTVADANAAPGETNAVRQALFTSRFEALVSQMGDQLQRTSISINVKERLDFSCALLDATGELIANAPHIPIHLGALGLCVRTVVYDMELDEGDIVITNHPQYGGSHLPDITAITPVFAGKSEPIGYVANRAHHAEIGGRTPGSMPPDARRLAEEGIAVEPVKVIEKGVARWERVEALLRGGRWPSRSVEDNLADLRAQVAANQRGRKLLEEMIAEHGAGEVALQMRKLTDRAARLAGSAISERAGRRWSARERLDDGHVLAVRIDFEADRALFDFAGSSGVHPGNLNATPAIVRSVVLYVMRLLIGDEIPLNEGILRNVEINLPSGMLNPPFAEMGREAPAIVGGNTEVSQRLTDTLVRALQLSACGQGTMNNVLWGNAAFGYYETVGGGSGAGPGFDGCSAIHTHMTNTRITDAEVLEYRYPVRVLEHAIRGGSGGGGKWRGGDGTRRIVEFLAPMDLSLLSQHRREAPFGMAGGSPGATGRQWIERADGTCADLEGIDGAEVGPGDRLVLETPGGGGWGRPPADDQPSEG